MHNIYAMGGLVKVGDTTCKYTGRKRTSCNNYFSFRGADSPYFELHSAIKVKVLVDYRLKLKILELLRQIVSKVYPFLNTKVISQFEPGKSQFSSYVEKND